MSSSLNEVEARNRRGGPSNLSWLNYNRYYNSIRDEEANRLDGGKENLAGIEPQHYRPPAQSNAKLDMVTARQALQWVEEVTGRAVVSSRGPVTDHLDMHEALKNGQVLCDLINKVFPGSIRKINHSNAPFKERENIEMFLKACQLNGMSETDTFHVDDLYEARSLQSVVNTLHTLGSVAQRRGFRGPVLGVRHAERNLRNFSNETMAQGRTFIGLQMGGHVGASQAGMTAPGTFRHI